MARLLPESLPPEKRQAFDVRNLMRGYWQLCSSPRFLLLAAEDHARRQGRVRMDLTTAHTNHAAQALYEAMGWELDTVFRAYTRRVA